MIGFHVIPSLLPLHLHIISSDFNSDHLKTKRHYNSFTTKFFIKINDIINHLESNNNNINSIIGSKEYYEGLLKSDMKCNRCGIVLNNIPNLKKHLHSCNK
jgi:aprataxin